VPSLFKTKTQPSDPMAAAPFPLAPIREAAAEGSSERLAQEPDSPERAAKGDLGFGSMPAPRPLTTNQPPWKGLRQR